VVQTFEADVLSVAEEATPVVASVAPVIEAQGLEVVVVVEQAFAVAGEGDSPHLKAERPHSLDQRVRYFYGVPTKTQTEVTL
jgi:hypothetical protein